MQQAGYHHANMLAEQLRTDLQAQGNEMLALVQEMAAVNVNPPNEEVQPPQVPAANAVIQDTVQHEMLQLLRSIAANGNNGGQSGRNGRVGRNSRGGNGGRGNQTRVNRRTPDNAIFNQRITDLYCHTHGACNHASTNCASKARGHEDQATITNRMGGSNAFCAE